VPKPWHSKPKPRDPGAKSKLQGKNRLFCVPANSFIFNNLALGS
jgi:hypothetical protein